VFWSVDLPFSAVTGYLTGEGATELRATKALRHYVCTWFPLDFGLVLMDWGELIFGDATGANAARMGKTIKTVRMLRMMRLCRLARMKTLPEMVRTFIERFQSELAHIIAGLVKMIVMIIWFHHVTACVWLYLAMSRSERSDRNWLDKYGLSREGFYYQYCTSFHWSLTQFAGSMEVTPTNSTERLFAVCSLLVAFTVAAWVVSTLTTSMTRLEIAAGEEGKKLTDLTDWLIDNQISSALMARVRRNFRFAMLEERRGRPNVEMLRMLSKPLQAELSFEVHMKTLGVHPFLRTYAVSFESVAQQVCFRAVGLLQAVEGDQLFLEGQAPLEPKVYFVTSGALAYAQTADDGHVTTEEVHCEEWVSEPALWTQWVHQGLLGARAVSAVLQLDCLEFQGIASSAAGLATALAYGREFVRQLNRGRLTDLRDLDMDLESMALDAIPEKLRGSTGRRRRNTTARSVRRATASLVKSRSLY